MAVCCQNLTLGALSSHSALSVLVGTLFQKFGPFFNTPCILGKGHEYVQMEALMRIMQVQTTVKF